LAEIALIRGQQSSTGDAQVEFLRATRLFGAAEAIREPVNSRIDLVDLPVYHQHIEVLREKLGEASFTKTWDEGRGKTLEQAVGFALDPQ
jgi:hypothetical protein